MTVVELAEVTDNDCNNGGPTVSPVDPLHATPVAVMKLTDVALMVVDPWLRPVASPPEEMVATPFAEVVQATEAVRSCSGCVVETSNRCKLHRQACRYCLITGN